MTFPNMERWLPIPGYEEIYSASSLGRIYSQPRNGTSGGILRQRLYRRNKYKIWRVNLSRDDEEVTRTVHSLVAAAFLGPCPPGQQILHGPRGSLDNSVANLSYGTAAKNLGADKIRDGTMQCGERNGNARLTGGAVLVARWLWVQGMSPQQLADWNEVSDTTICNAVKGETWRHLPVYVLPR